MKYRFTINQHFFIISQDLFNTIDLYNRGLIYRYRLVDELVDAIKEKNLKERTGLPIVSLVEQIVGMQERGEYEVVRVYYRCEVMIQFCTDRSYKYNCFFESRTTHQIEEDQLPNRDSIMQELDDEAWYQLITVPSIIDAYKKDTIYYKYGTEECVPIDEDELEGELCEVYRYMERYFKGDTGVFEHDRIECDLYRIEEKIKELTIMDFTRTPIDKQEIIRWLRLGYWERTFRALYRIWHEALNCKTNQPFIFWKPKR